jgi:hypothetical protein
MFDCRIAGLALAGRLSAFFLRPICETLPPVIPRSLVLSRSLRRPGRSLFSHFRVSSLLNASSPTSPSVLLAISKALCRRQNPGKRSHPLNPPTPCLSYSRECSAPVAGFESVPGTHFGSRIKVHGGSGWSRSTAKVDFQIREIERIVPAHPAADFQQIRNVH